MTDPRPPDRRPPAPLAGRPVLVLDCQSTGSHAAGGRLLEIGWAGARAEDAGPAVDSAVRHLLQPPADLRLSPAVRRLTGLAEPDLAAGIRPATAWKELAAAARRVAGRRRLCPTVIHCAAFETPFLRELHRRFGDDAPFPLQIVCTLQIARRLYPDLPRRGLRALAGYFGHGVAETRRCGPHVAATALIWREIAGRLAKRHGIRGFDQLDEWLRRNPPGRSAARRFPMARARRRPLQAAPGVYRMLRADGTVLYVGKARSLRSRVNSYFQSRRRHPGHILDMLTQARRVAATPTGSALEAALLESDEIKRLAPPYNLALHSRNRRIWYACRRLRSFAPRRDAHHPLGPLPARRFPRVMGWLADHLADGHPAVDPGPAERLFPHADPCPGPLEIEAALTIFRRRHGRELTGSRSVDLMRIGGRLWMKRAQRSDGEDDSPPDDGEMTTGPAAPQDPESLAGVLENAVCSAAHLIRRSRWLNLLGAAALVWERPGERRAALLVFSSGRLLYRGRVRWGEQAAVIGTFQRRRSPGFDLADYDRLRVATTELRRLAGEGRRLEVHPRRGACIPTQGLTRVLERV